MMFAQRDRKSEGKRYYKRCTKIWESHWFCGTVFSWSEKSHRFPCRGSGYITRVFLCWCLLRWLDNSSNSVDNWIFTKRASSICRCNRCYCSGNMDYIPLCSGCFYSIIPISTAPVFWLGQLITFMIDSQVVKNVEASTDASLDGYCYYLLKIIYDFPYLPNQIDWNPSEIF